MKATKIFLFINAALLLAVGGVLANGANLPVYKAAHAPSIDGVLDPLWYNIPWNRDFKVQDGAALWEGWTDAALSFRIMVDEHYLYMFLTANDDTLIQDDNSDNYNNDDSFQLWFDGDNSKGTAYDGVNDLGILFVVDPKDSTHWVMSPILESGSPANLDLSGVLYAAIPTALGIDLEIAIPIEILGINTTAGSLFGLEVDYNDDDGEGDPLRDTKLKYFSDQDLSNTDPSTLGTAEIQDREVSETLDVWYTTTPPVIDGTVDEMWADVPEVDAGNLISGQLKNYADAALLTKVVWDTTSLYFLFIVKDDTLRRQTPEPANSQAAWQSDCVEFYMDPDNGKTASNDGVNDRVWDIAYQDPTAVMDTAYIASTPLVPMGGVNQGSALTADGFVLEVSFPLDSLGIMPLNHWKFGFDADYDDNDAGITRDRKIKTYATIDGAYNQPALWGTAELFGGPVEDYTPPVTTEIPNVMNTTTMPTIDGKLDSAWVNVPPVPITNVVEGTITNWWDSWGVYKIMWDKTNLYLFVNVHDDTVITTNADPTQNDGLVICFDGDNKKTTAYDEKNDDAIQFVYGQAPVNLTSYSKNIDVTKWTYAWRKIATGYNLEVLMTIKNGLKFTPFAGKLAGFDIQINDNDTGVRDAMLKWSSTTATSPTLPSEMGTIQIVAKEVSSILDIPFTSYPVFIDGDVDYAWGDAASLWANYYMADEKNRTSLDDVTLMWKTMWNMDYLFFLIHVKDDTLVRDSGTAGYNDDSVELWLDGNNSKGATYDGIDDRGFSFRYNPENPALIDTGTISGATFDEKTIMQAAKRTEDGFMLELALPLTGLGISIGDGTEFGIDMDYDDDDDGGVRDTKVKTFSAIDESYRYPYVLGTARLTGSGLTDVDAIVVVPKAFGLSQNYPNPFNPSTKINYSIQKHGLVKIVVYDLLGREVAVLVNEVKPAGIYTVQFDASKLTSGIYIYRIEAAGKVESKKLMLLK